MNVPVNNWNLNTMNTSTGSIMVTIVSLISCLINTAFHAYDFIKMDDGYFKEEYIVSRASLLISSLSSILDFVMLFSIIMDHHLMFQLSHFNKVVFSTYALLIVFVIFFVNLQLAEMLLTSYHVVLFLLSILIGIGSCAYYIMFLNRSYQQSNRRQRRAVVRLIRNAARG